MIADDFSHVDARGPEKIVTVADPRSGMRGALVIGNTPGAWAWAARA